MEPLPTAPAVVYAPCTGRAWYLLVVENCPWCGAAHAHRTPIVPKEMIRRCRRWGRRYWVSPRVRRNVARRKWAA